MINHEICEETQCDVKNKLTNKNPLFSCFRMSELFLGTSAYACHYSGVSAGFFFSKIEKRTSVLHLPKQYVLI